MNVRSFIIGPPAVAPNWLRLNGGFFASKKLEASSALFRMNSYTLPWNSLVPERVIALITPPEERPYSAGYVLLRTENSETASDPKSGPGRVQGAEFE